MNFTPLEIIRQNNEDFCELQDLDNFGRLDRTDLLS